MIVVKVLLIIMASVSSAQSKTYMVKSVAESSWTVEKILKGQKSLKMCRAACTLEDSGIDSVCKAFHFNETSQECQMGQVADDPAYLHLGYGVKVFLDIDLGVPQHYPHVTLYEHEISFGTMDLAPQNSVAPILSGYDRDFAVRMVYDERGIFACSTETTIACEFQALGSGVVEDLPKYEVDRGVGPGHVALGPKTLWLLGGETSDVSTEIFSHGKWIPGPDLPKECTNRRGPGVAKIKPQEVLIFGGSCTEVEFVKMTHSYSFVTEEWTRKADMNVAKRNLIGNNVLELSNGTRVVVTVCGLANTMLKTVEMYNIEADVWVQMTDMPIASNGVPTAVVNNKLYIFGYQGESNILEYEPDTDTWADTGSVVPEIIMKQAPLVFNL